MGHRISIWAQKDRFEPEVLGREVVPISVTRTLELDSIFKMHSELYNVRGKVHCRHGFIHSFGGWLGGPIQYYTCCSRVFGTVTTR